MGQVMDMSGQKFHWLTVIKRADNDKYGQAMWLCACDCGAKSAVRGSLLRRGNTKSCGCWNSVSLANLKRTHAMRYSPEYSSWRNMKNRCLNKNVDAFKYYGGRGITVCDRWLESFENFYEDMGLRPTPEHSIDRLDSNGNYEPSNCKWSTKKEQMRNTRVNIMVGDICLAEYCELHSFHYPKILARNYKGIPVEYAITHDLRQYKALLKSQLIA